MSQDIKLIHNLRLKNNQNKERDIDDESDWPIKNGKQIIECSIIYQISSMINLNGITSLSLPSSKLLILPNALKMLPIRELNVMDNFIEDIPNCLYLGLESIRKLNLSLNPLRRFDQKPKCYINLTWLSIASCHFNAVPTWLLEMKSVNLEHLDYSNNQLSSLNRLDTPIMDVKLKNLLFQNSNIRQKMVEFLKSFTLLQKLDLSNNTSCNENVIIDINALFTNVSWHFSMKILQLNALQINDLPEEFCNLINLEELHLKYNNLSCLPESITRLQKLRVLDISNNVFYSMEFIKYFTSLEYFYASCNNVTSICIDGLNALYCLDLYNNYIDVVQSNKQILNKLQYMDMDENYIQDDFIATISEYEKKREALRSTLPYNNRLNGQKQEQCLEDDEFEINKFDYDCREYSDEESDKYEMWNSSQQDDEPASFSDWDDLPDEVTFSDSELNEEKLRNYQTKNDRKKISNPLRVEQEDLFIDVD